MMNNLEAVIQSVIARATSTIATEIAQSVRQWIGAELLGTVGSSVAAVAATPEKKKRGRPRKVVAVAAPSAVAEAQSVPVKAGEAPKPAKAPKQPVKAKGKKQGKVGEKRGRGFRTYTEADLARAMEVIKAKPGLLPSQYQAQSGIDKKVWDNVIYKLKTDGKIKVHGKARNTSYVVA